MGLDDRGWISLHHPDPNNAIAIANVGDGTGNYAKQGGGEMAKKTMFSYEIVLIEVSIIYLVIYFSMNSRCLLWKSGKQ